MWKQWTDQIDNALAKTNFFRMYGRVSQVVGMTIESNGPSARLGDICVIKTQSSADCLAEVVGFRDSKLVLMPLGDLSAIGQGAEVMALHSALEVPCGDGLLGRIVDGLGHPLDELGDIEHGVAVPITGAPPNPLSRQRIESQLQTGVRAIDGLLSVGEGQRMGIFAGSGVGKSTLLSMIARSSSADVNVIALIGERGREVREFIERDLGEEGLARSVLVVSTSDQPPLIRLKAAFVATAIAEYFREQGQRVNFMMDSVTRFAMAQREVGLAVGEPPTSRGYTPSVFALLPRLLERTGTSEKGSITAFYTVLVDGDDLNDPIADAVRGILDGHIVLSRQYANAGRFPAIDVLASISRLFTTLASRSHRDAAIQVRSWLQRYLEVEDLLRIGAYQQGSDKDTDLAISMYPRLRQFLEQEAGDESPLETTLEQLYQLAGVSA